VEDRQLIDGGIVNRLFENRLIGGSFMLADFAVVPMGVTGGVKELVAEALKIVDEPCTPPSKEIQIASWT
jgi:hypothetical protein